MFRKRKVTLLEEQMVNAEIDIRVGIGQYLLRQLLRYGYSNTKLAIKMMGSKKGYADYVFIAEPDRPYRKDAVIVWLESGFPTGPNREELRPHLWKIQIPMRPEQIEYVSKYDLKGKLMEKDV